MAMTMSTFVTGTAMAGKVVSNSSVSPQSEHDPLESMFHAVAPPACRILPCPALRLVIKALNGAVACLRAAHHHAPHHQVRAHWPIQRVVR